MCQNIVRGDRFRAYLSMEEERYREPICDGTVNLHEGTKEGPVIADPGGPSLVPHPDRANADVYGRLGQLCLIPGNLSGGHSCM